MGYPDMRVIGDNYNPGGGRVQMSQFIGVVKMLVIAMVLFKFNPWTYLGYEVAGPTPNIVTWALENKLISSGAFEVSVNGEVVWSKLEMGNPPQPQQLLNLVVEKLREHSKQVGGMEEVDFRDEL